MLPELSRARLNSFSVMLYLSYVSVTYYYNNLIIYNIIILITIIREYVGSYGRGVVSPEVFLFPGGFQKC